MKKKNAVALIVGSNALTILGMMTVFGMAVRENEKHMEQVKKNVRILHTALEDFARAAPPEISKPIVDNLAFEWTVRDLV